jgi:hypothetical protein
MQQADECHIQQPYAENSFKQLSMYGRQMQTAFLRHAKTVANHIHNCAEIGCKQYS